MKYIGCGLRTFSCQQHKFIEELLCLREEQRKHEERARWEEQQKRLKEEQKRKFDKMMNQVHWIKNEMLFLNEKKINLITMLHYNIKYIIVCHGQGKMSALYDRMNGLKNEMFQTYQKVTQVGCVRIKSDDKTRSLLTWDYIEADETNVISGIKMINKAIGAGGGRVAIVCDNNAFCRGASLCAAFLMKNEKMCAYDAVKFMENCIEGLEVSDEDKKDLKIIGVLLECSDNGDWSGAWNEVNSNNLIAIETFRCFDELWKGLEKLKKLHSVKMNVVSSDVTNNKGNGGGNGMRQDKSENNDQVMKQHKDKRKGKCEMELDEEIQYF